MNSPLYKEEIEEQQKQKIKRDGNFELLLTNYFQPSYASVQNFIIEQMTKTVSKIDDSYTKDYYHWVIENLNTLQLAELKDVSKFEQSKQENIPTGPNF